MTPALSGQGSGQENGRTASMIEDYAGVLRDYEAEAGHVDHALAIVVPARMLARDFTYPALAFDSNSSNYGGNIPMGARLALPKALRIAELGLQTDFGRLIAQAAQQYGMFVVDQGGSGISIVTEARPTAPALAKSSAAAERDVTAIVHNLQHVPDHERVPSTARGSP
jgi:hypothetical protein